MQAKHRYIWIFGGICLAYLLIMVLVGKYVLHESDIENEEVFTTSVHYSNDNTLYTEEDSVETEQTYQMEGKESFGNTGDLDGGAERESLSDVQVASAEDAGLENAAPAEGSENNAGSENAASAEGSENKESVSEKKKPKPTENPIFYGYKNVSKERKKAVRLAKKYVGKISYYWGGKPTGEDILGETDPHRLDCSGFIQFICSKVLGERINSVGATILISTLNKISKEELKPGDIGLKLGTGSLYFDADGNAYPDPGRAENANENHIKNAKKQIGQLRQKKSLAADLILEKKEKIKEWKEKRLSIVKKTSEYGKIRISKSKYSFTVLEAEDEEAEEKLEEYSERYYNYGWHIRRALKAIQRYREKRTEYDEEILAQKNIIKKYDVAIRKSIDHVGLYCGKDKDGREIWCHCSSSGHGVVWENTDLFRYYYRYFE